MPVWFRLAAGIGIYIAILATIGHLGLLVLKWWLRRKGWIE